ncbi:hypothetical protein ACVJGD_003961 [Bradyrhizobium sp. USDA 10063]
MEWRKSYSSVGLRTFSVREQTGSLEIGANELGYGVGCDYPPSLVTCRTAGEGVRFIVQDLENLA